MAMAKITPTPIMAEVERRYNNCVLVKAHTGHPSCADISDLVTAATAVVQNQKWEATATATNHFLLHCYNEERMAEVLLLKGLEGRGRDGMEFYVTFKRWSRVEGALKVQSLYSVWIRLFNLPYHCWVRTGFQDAVRSFGMILDIDRGTLTHSNIEFARLRIGVVNKHDIPSIICIDFEEERFEVKVITEAKKSVSFRGRQTLEEERAEEGGDEREVEDVPRPLDRREVDRDRSIPFKTFDSSHPFDVYRFNPSRCATQGTNVSAVARAHVGSGMDEVPLGKVRRVIGEKPMCGDRTAELTSLKQGILKNHGTGAAFEGRGFEGEVNTALSFSKKEVEGSIRLALKAILSNREANGPNGFSGPEPGEASPTIIGPGCSSNYLVTGPSSGIQKLHDHDGLLRQQITGDQFDSGRHDDQFPRSEEGENMIDVVQPIGNQNPILSIQEENEEENEMIGALEGIREDNLISITDAEEEEKEGGISMPASTGTKEAEFPRKSKRQLDKWGLEGPSEAGLIRAAAKGKEPASACGGNRGSMKRLRMEDEE